MGLGIRYKALFHIPKMQMRTVYSNIQQIPKSPHHRIVLKEDTLAVKFTSCLGLNFADLVTRS